MYQPACLYNLACYKAYQEQLNLAQLPECIASDVLPCCRWDVGKEFTEIIILTAFRYEHHACIAKLRQKCIYCTNTKFLVWLSKHGSVKSVFKYAALQKTEHSLLLAGLIERGRKQTFLDIFMYYDIRLSPEINDAVIEAAVQKKDAEFVRVLLEHLKFRLNGRAVRIAMQCTNNSLTHLVIYNHLSNFDIKLSAELLVCKLFELIGEEIYDKRVEITFQANSVLPGSESAEKAFDYWRWLKILLKHSNSKIQREIVKAYKKRLEEIAMMGKSFWNYCNLMNGLEFQNVKALYGASKGINLEMLRYILPNVSSYNSYKVLSYIMHSANVKWYRNDFNLSDEYGASCDRWQKIQACLKYVLGFKSHYIEEEVTKLYYCAVCFPGTSVMGLFIANEDMEIKSLYALKNIMQNAIHTANVEAVKVIDNLMEGYDDAAFQHDCCNLAASLDNTEILNFFHSRRYFWDEETCEWAVLCRSMASLKYLRENGCPWNCQAMLAAASRIAWFEGLDYCFNNLDDDIESDDIASLLPKVDYTPVVTIPMKNSVYNLYSE